jgi:ABC-type branched-subunit amino acid transport system substrate-binding protein
MKYSFVVLCLITFASTARSAKLIFLDNSVTNDTYIPSNKKKHIEVAFDMAISAIKKNYVQCNLDSSVMIGRTNPLEIFEKARLIKSDEKQKNFVVGLIHSSEALLAAKAFKNSPILALSSGAATDTLHSENENFFSLANPVKRITSHVVSFISKKKVQNTIAIIPGNSSYSLELSRSLQSGLKELKIEMKIHSIDLLKSFAIDKDIPQLHKYDFVYVPGFIQQTLPIIESLSSANFRGIIYGSANLARSKPDLNLFSNRLKLAGTNIFFPATWISKETPASIKIEKAFLKSNNEEIMGTAIYTYDAALIAASYLCSSAKYSNSSFGKFIKDKVIPNKIGTIRKYKQLINGHLISDISTVLYNVKNKTFEKVFAD